MTEQIAIKNLDLAGIDLLATAMVQHLPPHVAIGLVGTLGAGKTALTQAIARAAGVDSSEVTSPTFTLLQTHAGNPAIHHLDAYRVADEDEFLSLGVDELFEDTRAWTIVEWADRIESVMPPETLWIKLEIETDDLRNISIACDEQSTAERMIEIANRLAQENSPNR